MSSRTLTCGGRKRRWCCGGGDSGGSRTDARTTAVYLRCLSLATFCDGGGGWGRYACLISCAEGGCGGPLNGTKTDVLFRDKLGRVERDFAKSLTILHFSGFTAVVDAETVEEVLNFELDEVVLEDLEEDEVLVSGTPPGPP